MQGAQKLRNEAYLWVRCNDSPSEINPRMNLPLGKQIFSLYLQCGVSISQGGGDAQRGRWIFYEAIKVRSDERCVAVLLNQARQKYVYRVK